MIRTGIGYDIHRFVVGRQLVLGRVVIPHDRGLEGHSDADVLLHAIADAMLGAAALGDIGQHFPPSNPALAGMDSRIILKTANGLLHEAGYEVVNIDSTVIAESPRLSAHIEAMRGSIALAVALPASSVSVKATTNERLGAVGRDEGIAALAIVSVAGRVDTP